jgi:hypothetical protein
LEYFSSPPGPDQLWGGAVLTTHFTSAEVKNAWSCLYLHSSYVFTAWFLIKHSDSFILCGVVSPEAKAAME